MSKFEDPNIGKLPQPYRILLSLGLFQKRDEHFTQTYIVLGSPNIMKEVFAAIRL